MRVVEWFVQTNARSAKRMNYEQVARRIEIATRNRAIFSLNELQNKGMDDRRRITELYMELKDDENLDENLKQARIMILIDILREEIKNGIQDTNGGAATEARREDVKTRGEVEQVGEPSSNQTNP
jgi:hypothetical protein